ncbi:hypothetical protein D9C73_012755 [Collichthys lucidus]|uniref:Uncharacterized protein n=1 Tax=Collichthys lucidus TaxID=240159 RepID=A0A4U5UTX3_COLLU|nr:hypothetical protein D9C73_012755 [Collichthys lucidus]
MQESQTVTDKHGDLQTKAILRQDPSLALKPANNQCKRKKLAGIEEEGVEEEKEVEDEERTLQEEAVIKK